MKLEKLTIALTNDYRDPGPNNPYSAKLHVSYNDTSMQVALSDAACRRILALAADEIGQAAQVQINDFVRTALAVSDHEMIEASAD